MKKIINKTLRKRVLCIMAFFNWPSASVLRVCLSSFYNAILTLPSKSPAGLRRHCWSFSNTGRRRLRRLHPPATAPFISFRMFFTQRDVESPFSSFISSHSLPYCFFSFSSFILLFTLASLRHIYIFFTLPSLHFPRIASSPSPKRLFSFDSVLLFNVLNI